MSDQFGDYYSRLGPPRPLTDAEYEIVAKLVGQAPHAKKLLEQLRDAQMRDMPDGGMGSLYFCRPGSASSEHRLGSQIAEAAFTDADGTPTSVTLDLDESGNLNEFDVFKADGSPLTRDPAIADVEVIERNRQPGFGPSRVPQDR